MPDVAEEALTYKKYHEWGYRFNASGRVQDLTQAQKELIQLGEMAEAYVKEQHQKTQQRGGMTQSNLENRPSKRQRINDAKQKYVG